GDRVARPREQLEAAHRRDRGQRLAAEAERADRAQVLERGDLAGRVAEHGELGVLAGHALAVVGHADVARAAALDLDLDRARAGVDRVLDQLLDHARGPLDDLAGGDLIRERVVEDADARSHARALSPGVRSVEDASISILADGGAAP